MSELSQPKGTFDLLPTRLVSENWHDVTLWQEIERMIARECHLWGFEEVRLPLIEYTELFQKSSGESSDIVQKEMYTFEDKGGRLLTLRPEGTPSAIRALVQARAWDQLTLQKVFYYGPMFRYERPQQGRYRQFHQLAVEAIGPRSPSLDSELITLGWSLLQQLGISQISLQLHTLGDLSAREHYKEALRDYLEPWKDGLSQESQRRLESNPLRILDSKNPSDQALLAEAPLLLSYLSTSSRLFFDEVLEELTLSNIPYQINHRLVRGLDYYCDTVFEFVGGSLGSQNALGGGGRYGTLVEQMGGPPLEGVGFAFGMERLVQCYARQDPQKPYDALLIALDRTSHLELLPLARAARAAGLSCILWPLHETRKLKHALTYAHKLPARYVVILGESEREAGVVRVKEMSSGQETLLSQTQLLSYLASS